MFASACCNTIFDMNPDVPLMKRWKIQKELVIPSIPGKFFYYGHFLQKKNEPRVKKAICHHYDVTTSSKVGNGLL